MYQDSKDSKRTLFPILYRFVLNILWYEGPGNGFPSTHCTRRENGVEPARDMPADEGTRALLPHPADRVAELASLIETVFCYHRRDSHGLAAVLYARARESTA